MSKERKDKAPLQDFMAGAINELVERGEFDNLKGKGKPLRINADDVLNPKMLAGKLLKDANYPPPWKMLEDEIQRDIERAEQDILRAQRSRQAALGQPRADPQVTEQQWQQSVQFLHSRVAEVNKKILKFNITIPPLMPHLYKPRLRVENILEKLNIEV